MCVGVGPTEEKEGDAWKRAQHYELRPIERGKSRSRQRAQTSALQVLLNVALHIGRDLRRNL